jgi:hypothetical protein
MSSGNQSLNTVQAETVKTWKGHWLGQKLLASSKHKRKKKEGKVNEGREGRGKKRDRQTRGAKMGTDSIKIVSDSTFPSLSLSLVSFASIEEGEGEEASCFVSISERKRRRKRGMTKFKKWGKLSPETEVNE